MVNRLKNLYKDNLSIIVVNNIEGKCRLDGNMEEKSQEGNKTLQHKALSWSPASRIN